MEWDEVKDAFKRQIPVYYYNASGTYGAPIKCCRIAEIGHRADDNGTIHRFVGAIGETAHCLYYGAPEAFSLTRKTAGGCDN